jgi:hypothetical protein
VESVVALDDDDSSHGGTTRSHDTRTLPGEIAGQGAPVSDG